MYRNSYARLRRLRLYGTNNLHRIPHLQALTERDRLAIATVALVYPFRVNNYVVDELIDWRHWRSDPLFALSFPQPGMLGEGEFQTLFELLRKDAPARRIQRAVHSIRLKMNPHPAGQADLNVPCLDGRPLPGLQHKYRETVLYFPRRGQTCHTYCTYCFRWPQFIGDPDLKIATSDVDALVEYLLRHREVTDVLITGGDPLVMSAEQLRRIIDALLDPRLEHVQNLRIGTKALSWWPYRFVTDRDSDDLLRLFEKVNEAGRQLAFMAHVSHPRELETAIAEEAFGRVLSTGAVIRCQSPLVRHVNADAQVWARMWRRQVKLGAVPYYMFVQRNTGANHHFEVPLLEAWEIYRAAFASVSGLARTARGPSMSALPGKVVVNGVVEIEGEEVFMLELVQARNPEWVGRPFFAELDPTATWLDQLEPAFGASEFFYEQGLRRFRRGDQSGLKNLQSRG